MSCLIESMSLFAEADDNTVVKQDLGHDSRLQVDISHSFWELQALVRSRRLSSNAASLLVLPIRQG